MLINLHTHLEGRVRPGTAAELAANIGLQGSPSQWSEALQLEQPSNLTTYLQKVSATYPFFAHREALVRIAREAVEDAADDGQDYLELRFGPATHRREGFELADVIAAVCEGVDQGRQATGMAAGIVIAALRLHDPETNDAVARAAASFAGEGVVGFDLAGDEALYPDLEPHANAFAIAKAAGLGLTCHAAEAGPGMAAVEAVDILGVTRIGHGAHIIDDPLALEQISDRGVVVEVCPSSNWFTGAISSMNEHPAPKFRKAGIGVVMGDDNPVQTGSLLSREAELLRHELGFGEEGLRNIAQTSLRSAFLSEGDRGMLLRKFAGHS